MLVVANLGKYVLLTFAAWIIINLAIVAFKWLQGVALKPSEPYFLDLRNDKDKIGKSFTIATVKANPFKNIWFGHIWVDWHEAPDGGFKETGIYAKCRKSAALNLFLATISPFSIFFGQRPIEATI